MNGNIVISPTKGTRCRCMFPSKAMAQRDALRSVELRTEVGYMLSELAWSFLFGLAFARPWKSEEIEGIP